MKIYVSKRDENVTAKLDESYSTEQTVILDYLTGPKTGKNICITISTLKRWWKETEIKDVIEDETDVNLELLAGGDSKEQVEKGLNERKSVVEEDTKVSNELTDNEYAKIGLEITEQTKLKTEKAKVRKRIKSSNLDRKEDYVKIDSYLNNNYDNKYYTSSRCYKIMKMGKTVAEIYPQNKKISCYFKSLINLDLSDVCMYRDGYKYYLPARVDISYDKDYIKIIERLLKEV